MNTSVAFVVSNMRMITTNMALFKNCYQTAFGSVDTLSDCSLLFLVLQRLGLGNLAPATSLVFCCDMQERFKPAIKYFDEIVAVGGRVLKAAQLLDIPVIVTEQVIFFWLFNTLSAKDKLSRPLFCILYAKDEITRSSGKFIFEDFSTVQMTIFY